MPTFHRMHQLAAAVLLSAMAAATAAPVPPAPAPAPTKPVTAQDTAPTASPASASQERLRIGLSDRSTKLVLPWFITELKDAVNEGKSVEATAKGLAQGL